MSDTSPLNSSKLQMLRLIEKEIETMAILSKREYDKWIKQVKHDENKKLGLVPTPKLKQALEIIRNMQNETTVRE